MPTYSFKCPKCSLRFEKTLKTSDNSEIKCVDCGESVNKLPATGVGMKMAAPTKIPKDIDLAVGKDSERKWMEYEDKKKIKDKIREESGSEKLSVNLDGGYEPFAMNVDGKQVSGTEATKYRKEMLNDYIAIKNDPDTVKNVPDKEAFASSKE